MQITDFKLSHLMLTVKAICTKHTPDRKASIRRDKILKDTKNIYETQMKLLKPFEYANERQQEDYYDTNTPRIEN